MDIAQEIERVLKEKPYGLSIEEVSQALKINRSTASKYLFAMGAEKRVVVREIGKVKLHYPGGVKL